MSLFIWNDYNWNLIEASDDYDKSSFFIVRKLFVQWPKEGEASACNDSIRQHFETHGSVGAVHTVNEESIDVNATNQTSIHEAYVTFECSEDAFNAFMANRRGSKAIKVLPADTWRQPGVVLTPPEEIKATNDADPCCKKTSFSDVMKDFCDCGQVAPIIHLGQEFVLKKWFEFIRPYKNRVNQCEIIFDVKPKDSQVNCLSDREYVKRAIQVLCTCVGERFKQLTISDAKTITLDLLDDLAPMLKRLEKLKLIVDSNASVLYALPEYCPNLQCLELVAMSWDGECSDSVVQHWPSISELILIGSVKIDSDTESGEKFQRFIELNPQLKELTLHTVVDNGTFAAVAEHLPNLEQLSFARQSYDDVDLILDQLVQMKHLSSVRMNTLIVEKNGLSAMAACAKQFREMKKLKFALLFQNLEPSTAQKEEFMRLFSCSIIEHDGCHCHGNERALEIGNVQAEKKPTVKLPKDRPVFVAAINTMDYWASADAALMFKILAGCEATKQFYPNVIDKTLIQGPNHFLSIYISHA